MKSKIKFKIHLLINQVHFLDALVSLKHGKLRTAMCKNFIECGLHEKK